MYEHLPTGLARCLRRRPPGRPPSRCASPGPSRPHGYCGWISLHSLRQRALLAGNACTLFMKS